MSLSFKSFIKRFGIFEGAKLYLNFRYGKTNVLRLSELKQPLYMKPNSIDNSSFQEIFLDEEYAIDYSYFITEHPFIIDAGANIGFSSVFFANKFPNAKIIAIEPDDENFRWLKMNTENYTSIIQVKGAIWRDSVSLRCLDHGWGTRGYMIEELSSPSEQCVQGFSIFSIMTEHNVQTLDILKMDIEGSEKEVFESNYEQWLPRTKCIIIELHDRMREGSSHAVYAAIGQYNFRSFENGENIVFINLDI